MKKKLYAGGTKSVHIALGTYAMGACTAASASVRNANSAESIALFVRHYPTAPHYPKPLPKQHLRRSSLTCAQMMLMTLLQPIP